MSIDENIQQSNQYQHITWTEPLRRLAILSALTMQFDEPTLLVGEIGCGKTTISEILSHLKQQKLFTVNWHTTTESSDFLGSFRPIRDRENKGLFQLEDGALVCSMKESGLFLVDEISLADDESR